CHVGGEPSEDARPAMPHQKHLDRDLACVDCHDPEETGTPTLPAAETCFDCHEDLDDEPAAVRDFFKQTRQEDGSYAFTQRWKTRDTIENHPKHAAAGVACDQCHGQASNQPFSKTKSVALMQRCVSCHEDRKVATECKTCHSEIREPQHKDIVLRHAEDQRGCLDCHNPDDRDTLRLASGKKIPFAESYRLCGQCHGPKLRDWKLGLHGKRTGMWDGKKDYLLCVHCHQNPHQPRPPPMRPDPPPMRPEDVK
ncbi:MAG: cytochrome c3 family protein, partial [Planctomycetota bacterium]